MDAVMGVILFAAGAGLGGALTWWLFRVRPSADVAVLNSRLSAGLERQQELEDNLGRKEQDLNSLREAVSRAGQDNAVLRTTMEKEREAHDSRLKLLQESEDRLRKEFENLANRIFEEKTQAFSSQSKESLGNLLAPLKEQLGEFRRRIDDIYEKDTKERTSLASELKQLRDLNQQVSQDAVNLTNALKGESKTQGCWGEMVLEKILELSGLRAGYEYETQVHLRDKYGGQGSRYPDVVIRLPEGKDVVVDAKVTLKSYELYCSAQADTEKALHLKALLDATRTHVGGLSAKNYEGLAGLTSLDLVFMFMPIEGAFMLVMSRDPELYQEALKKGIMIVSPSTLQMTLRIVAGIWRHEYQDRNAIAIADKAGALYDKFVGFVENLQLVGKRIHDADAAYVDAMGQLSTGTGNLVKRTQDLLAMGVKAKKKLPRELAGACSEPDEPAALPVSAEASPPAP